MQLTLEEMGATGNLGLSQIALNPVIQGAMGGLAVSAAQHASVEVGMPGHCRPYLQHLVVPLLLLLCM